MISSVYYFANLEERNAYSFEGCGMTLLEVEHLFLRSLSEWMTVTTVFFFFG